MHTWDIIENPLGQFFVRKVAKDASEQYGPFPDLPAAIRGMNRAIRPTITRYDEDGKLIEVS